MLDETHRGTPQLITPEEGDPENAAIEMTWQMAAAEANAVRDAVETLADIMKEGGEMIAKAASS
jgi:hypothetical protein